MKMFLNFNSIWESGTYAVVPAEIYDEVEIINALKIRKCRAKNG